MELPIKSGFISGIEAMRGIAVIAVILYHFDADIVPSGFLGVDLFFIISGFVITKSLYKIKAESISEYLLYFYNARLKRIFPALVVFVFFTFILLALTSQFNILELRTGGLSLLGLSNLYLIKIQDNYFDLDQGFNVFNHTWSLGVEEQFYLLLPIVFFFLKSHQKKLIYISLILAVVSFTLYIVFSENSVIQYYSPITRLWQLMMGSIAYQLYKNNDIKINPLWTKLFFLLVLLCFFIDKDYINLIAPILSVASVLLIWGVCSQEDSVISNRYLVYIGGISYSLYLYHLPIIRLFNFPEYWSIVQFILLFVLAILSVELVEKPFRYGKLSKLTKKKVVGFSSISAIVFSFSIIGYSYAANDYYDHFSTPNHDKLKAAKWNNIGSTRSVLYSRGERSLFFVGDSHSDALTPTMIMLHEKNNLQINSIAVGGLFTTSMDSNKHGALSFKGNAIVKNILKNGKKGDVLVITNQLMTWFSNTYNDKYEDHRLLHNGDLLNRDEALIIFSKDLINLSRLLDEKEMDIIVFAPFPDFPVRSINCYSPILNSMEVSLDFNKCRTTRLEQDQRRFNILKALNDVSDGNLNFHIIDPINLVSSDGYTSAYKGTVPLYYDDDHPNFNFNQYIYPLFINTLNSI